jgi:hypothetical protein
LVALINRITIVRQLQRTMPDAQIKASNRCSIRRNADDNTTGIKSTGLARLATT